MRSGESFVAFERTFGPAEATTQNAIESLRLGQLVLLGSRLLRNGQGQSILVGAAALMSSSTVNMMAVHGRGLISIAVDRQTAFRLGLRRMEGSCRSSNPGAEYLVSIEASACQGTGISAKERAQTLRAAGAPDASQDDIVMPGHIMPYLISATCRALPEIAYEIVAGRTPYLGAAWCDVLDDAGDLATLRRSLALATKLGLPVMIAEDVCSARLLSVPARRPDSTSASVLYGITPTPCSAKKRAIVAKATVERSANF